MRLSQRLRKQRGGGNPNLYNQLVGAFNLETYNQVLEKPLNKNPSEYIVVSGSLPNGIYLDIDIDYNCLITGVPNDTVGSYNAVIVAKQNNYIIKTYKVTVDLGNIISLMHFDGANNSTTFTDLAGKSWTRRAGAVISTEKAKFGSSSFRSNYGNRLVIPYGSAGNTDFDFEDKDFSIDVWANADTFNTGSWPGIFAKRSGNNDNVFAFSLLGGSTTNPTCNMSAQFMWEVGTRLIIPTTNIISINTWQHFCLCRKDGVAYLFVDGVLMGAGDLPYIYMANSQQSVLVQLTTTPTQDTGQAL